MAPKRVLIIGAGLSGLTTLKEALSSPSLSPEIYDLLPHIGGQWAYTPPSSDNQEETISSIYASTILNSSRDCSGFSDFPLDPARYPWYFGHRRFLEYLREYAEQFGLMEHVRLGRRVVRCTPLGGDGKEGKGNGEGGWRVEWCYANGSGKGEVHSEVWDAICVCSGHNTLPRMPEFRDRERFKGTVMHSHLYRSPVGFAGKKVVVVGVGSSAVDVASEISTVASETRVVTRSGGWVLPRFVFGRPADELNSELVRADERCGTDESVGRAAQTLLPRWFSQWTYRVLLEFLEGKLPPELQPKHGIMEANPVIRSEFVERVRNGQITAHRASIERLTETGLLLSTGEEIEADVIICCTGFKIHFPYLADDVYKSKNPALADLDDAVDLYNLIQPANYDNLFIIGIIELAGPQAVASEVQARWVLGVLTGKVPLRSPEQRAKGIAEFQAEQAKHFLHSDRHAVTADFLLYLDKLTDELGATPTFARMLGRVFTSNPFRALKIMNAVYNCTAMAAQYRLFGDGASPQLAEETILRIAEDGKELRPREKELLASSNDKELDAEAWERLSGLKRAADVSVV